MSDLLPRRTLLSLSFTDPSFVPHLPFLESEQFKLHMTVRISQFGREHKGTTIPWPSNDRVS